MPQIVKKMLHKLRYRLTYKQAVLPIIGTNFTDGTLGPLGFSSYNGTGSWAPSTDYVDPGSAHSIKCTIPGSKLDDSAELIAQFGQGTLQPADPTLDQDLFQQVRFVLGPGAILAIGGVLPLPINKNSQFKVHKSTYGAVGANVNGWVMCSVGPWDHVGLASIPELYIGGGGALWPLPVLEGFVYDVVYRYHRYTALNAGTMAVWVNGLKVLDSPKQAWWGDKRGSTAGLRLRDGAEYLQSPLGPLSVYTLFTQATNFPIGAGVAS